MHLSRRAALTLACLALFPLPLRAAGCQPLVPGLTLCDATGWRLDGVEGATATLSHVTGPTASVTLLLNRTEEEQMWDGWMASHTPISARAKVLEVELTEILGLDATTTAYLPRDAKPAAVIALTSAQGDGRSLSVSTSAPGETFSDQHRQAHAGLLAALKLDPPE